MELQVPVSLQRLRCSHHHEPVTTGQSRALLSSYLRSPAIFTPSKSTGKHLDGGAMARGRQQIIQMEGLNSICPWTEAWAGQTAHLARGKTGDQITLST